MPAGTTRTTRVTPKGRAYLAEHPGIDWRAPDPGPRTVQQPTPIAAAILPLVIANAAICPPCGSGNILHIFGRLHVCRDCRHRFEAIPARSGA